MVNTIWHNCVTTHSNEQNSYEVSLTELIIKVGLFDKIQVINLNPKLSNTT